MPLRNGSGKGDDPHMNEKEQTQVQPAEQAPVGMRYVYKTVKSAKPVWVTALTWLICALLFPLYKIGWLIAAVGITVVVWLIARSVAEPETRRFTVPFSSGNPEVDDAVREFDRVAGIVEADRQAVADKYPAAAADMGEIVVGLGKIVECITEDPEDLRRCRRFMNYYLPTTVKLADKYVSISTKDDTANVLETRKAIESAFVQIKDAYNKQYDSLFANDALDITTDVVVLETMLKKDGLKTDLPESK